MLMSTFVSSVKKSKPVEENSRESDVYIICISEVCFFELVLVGCPGLNLLGMLHAVQFSINSKWDMLLESAL